MALTVLGAVFLICAAGLAGLELWLRAKTRETTAAREHELRLAELSRLKTNVALELLPAQMNDVMHRVKQLELLRR